MVGPTIRSCACDGQLQQSLSERLPAPRCCISLLGNAADEAMSLQCHLSAAGHATECRTILTAWHNAALAAEPHTLHSSDVQALVPHKQEASKLPFHVTLASSLGHHQHTWW